MLITYKENKDSIIVSLNNKIVGSIKKHSDNLFRYQRNESKNYGKPFKTIYEVKRSIEAYQLLSRI